MNRKMTVKMTALVVSLSLLTVGQVQAQKATLTIESWRNDDLKIWNTIIIPAFTKLHPEIEVKFAPSAPTEYNAILQTKLKGGTAGDIIACRPFDSSLELFKAKYLTSLNDLPGMNNFSKVAKTAWSTDDSSSTFCVPTASVIHGFLYNKAIFSELGVAIPKTETQFLAAMKKIKDNGKYSALVMGTKDQWESATMGFQNIGPTLWGAEKGRTGLLAGTAQYNKGGFLAAFKALAKWQPYLVSGYQALAYPDSQNFFAQGRGAVYPAGSWDIATFRQMNPKLELGAFPPYLFSGKQCTISDHPDIGFGLNAASPNKEAAKVFLSWLATDQFAQLYANAVPGFYPLADVNYTIADPVAQQFLSWRKTCDKTFRSSYQILSRNTNPNNENDLWNASSSILNGSMTPVEAANFVQKNLASWYGPQKGK